MKKILLAVLVAFGIHLQAQVTTVACNMMSLSVASAGLICAIQAII
jgi:hypothetical protein